MFKKNNSFFVINLFLLLVCVSINAQTITSTQNTIAVKNFKAAHKAMKAKDLEKSLLYAEKAIRADNACIEAYQLAAEVTSIMQQKEKSCYYYSKVIELAPNNYKSYYGAAYQYMECGFPDTAIMYFEQYINRHPTPNSISSEMRNDLELCRWRYEQMQKPVPINLINMGEHINSNWDEYLPAITADEAMLIFTVMRPKDKYTICFQCVTEEDLYSSKTDGNNNWTPREYLSNINTHFNEGGQCVSPDGKYMIYTACNRDEGFGSCDLYWSKRLGDTWSKPINCGKPLNTKFWESQPSFSADGKTIYFISNRPGGEGKKDIWKTTMIEDGVFSEPINLGKEINTPEDEVSVFIHPDGQTLYFASKGHKGMGDADIFMSVLKSDGSWSQPVNLGYPINTHVEDFSLVVNARGNKAYYASDKKDGFGGLDLYWFELPTHLRPNSVTYFKGKVFDAQDKKPLAATLELMDLTTRQVVVKSTSDPHTGEFIVCIPTDKQYAFTVINDKYLFYSENIAIKDIQLQEPIEKDVALKRIEIGESIVLENIFFDTDKSDLKKESLAELNRIVKLLQENPKMHVEIGGHTDNVGTQEHNVKLSTDRAKTVYDYLIQANINKERLSFHGYGFNKPIADNDTEEGRAKNRRTELTIVGF